MNKKAEMPFWLVITIFILLGLIVALAILFSISGKIRGLLGLFG